MTQYPLSNSMNSNIHKKLAPKLVVSKFGGTSMGSSERMLASAKVGIEQGAHIIVVSAVSGITNKLIELGHKAEKSEWSDCEMLLKEIKEQHHKIANELKLEKPEQEQLNKLLSDLESISRGIHLLKDCSLKALDSLQSFGERMSSVLFMAAIRENIKKQNLNKKANWLDARAIIKTDSYYGKAKALIEEIALSAQTYFKNTNWSDEIFVTQGFIGSTPDNSTSTLGRGGSDYSAALFAEAIGAETLEIWTDVKGIASTDPRICPQAQVIPEISFQEASELATFGAKVLHPATLLPAIRQNIPVFVGSSFESKVGGTWVKNQASNQPLVRALAMRKNQVLLTLSTPEMLNAPGFLFKIFNIFNELHISVDAITTSEISVSLTLDEPSLKPELIQALRPFADVQVEKNLCLVSLIGNNINHTPGLAQKIFSAIPDINVRMICLGASKHNFCFIVQEDQGALAIQRLHKVFIENS